LIVVLWIHELMRFSLPASREDNDQTGPHADLPLATW
jgi:hypothetical protein